MMIGEVQMVVLRIEHAVPDFASWKRAFDADPLGRERSGVRRYRVMRAVDDPKDVLIDLEFDTRTEAESLLAALHEVWRGPGGAVTRNPRARIVETVESREF
jgi:hypothetical protein